MDLSSLDFQQARIKQVLFKSQLRSILFGVKEADAATFSIRQNPMGQWLHMVGQPKYGQHPQIAEIGLLLQSMMSTGQELVNLYKRGKIEEARSGLERIDGFNEKISRLLQELEEAARAGG